jgi:hypothetical protein
MRTRPWTPYNIFAMRLSGQRSSDSLRRCAGRTALLERAAAAKQPQHDDEERLAAPENPEKAPRIILHEDYWPGAGVDPARLSQALPQLPNTAVELKAVAKK